MKRLATGSRRTDAKRLAILGALEVRAMLAVPAVPAVVAALAASSIAMSSAVAQPSSKARSDATAAYQEGQRRYLAEDYVGAAAQFEAAHKLDPDPAYLFNIAQAYRLAKDCGKALAFYKQFVAEVPKAPNADAVKKYIRELEAQCPNSATGRTSSQAPPISNSATAAGDPSPTVSDSSVPISDESPISSTGERRLDEPMPPVRKGHLVRNLGIGALGLGAIGVTMGVVFTFKVRGDEDEREALCPSFPCDWTSAKMQREDELLARGHRHETYMAAGYMLGGAALAAGVVMLVVSREPRDSSLAIVPTQGGAFVGLTLGY